MKGSRPAPLFRSALLPFSTPGLLREKTLFAATVVLTDTIEGEPSIGGTSTTFPAWAFMVDSNVLPHLME